MRTGSPVVTDEERAWGRLPHEYRNPSQEAKAVLCIDIPKFIPEDEIVLNPFTHTHNHTITQSHNHTNIYIHAHTSSQKHKHAKTRVHTHIYTHNTRSDKIMKEDGEEKMDMIKAPHNTGAYMHAHTRTRTCLCVRIVGKRTTFS